MQKVVTKEQLETLANQLVGDFTEPMPVPAWMVIDAVRYCIGRMTYQVSTTCEWLAANWDSLPQRAKGIIQRDIEEAFGRDDWARKNQDTGFPLPLGWDCDRAMWEQVRNLWRSKDAS